MRTVQNLLTASLALDFNQLSRESLISAGDDYIKIQQEQMMAGRLSTGKPITNVHTGRDTYSPTYARYKGKEKPIDLHDTGAFYDEMFIVDTDKAIVVDSADPKSGMLQDNYSEDIFTLDKDSRIKFRPIAQVALLGLTIMELNKK